MGEWFRRWILRIVVLVVVAFALTVGWLVYDGMHDSNGPADCAVVLCDPLGTDGKPTEESVQRLNYVASLLKSGGVKSVVLAAETPSTEAKTIEDGMTRYLATQNAPAASIMEDLNGSTPETMGTDVAAYLNSARQMSVLLAANYAEITRNKLALEDAGVATVVTWHSGSPNVNDAPKLAETAVTLWRNFFQKDVVPEAQKLAAQAKAETQNMVSSTEQQGTVAAKKAADTPSVPNTASPH